MDVRLKTLFCEKIIVAKSREINPGSNMVELLRNVTDQEIIMMMMVVMVAYNLYYKRAEWIGWINI
jgi:hypothetical protein